MNRATITISLVAMFLAGASLGLMGGILFTHHLPWPLHGPMAGPRPGHGFAGRIGGAAQRDAMGRLQRLLDLTPEQVARIEPRVLDSQKQFAAVRESLRSRIDAELTPAQHERWRQFQLERDRARERSNPGDPRGDDRDHRPRPDEGGAPR